VKYRFEIKRGRCHGLAVLTTTAIHDVIEHGLPNALRRHIAGCVKAECALRGLAVDGDLRFEAQANWLTGVADVTAIAFVSTLKPRVAHTNSRKRKQPATRRGRCLQAAS
jgi:hypothetical protein